METDNKIARWQDVATNLSDFRTVEIDKTSGDTYVFIRKGDTIETMLSWEEAQALADQIMAWEVIDTVEEIGDILDSRIKDEDGNPVSDEVVMKGMD